MVQSRHLDARKHFRLRRRVGLFWKIPSQSCSGRGRIFDISVSGVCFDTDSMFQPRAGTVFTIEAPGIPEFPKKATLRWFRRLNRPAVGYQCGVMFVKEGIFYPTSWREWVEARVAARIEDGEDKDEND